jgi:hypothetical protein
VRECPVLTETAVGVGDNIFLRTLQAHLKTWALTTKAIGFSRSELTASKPSDNIDG